MLGKFFKEVKAVPARSHFLKSFYRSSTVVVEEARAAGNHKRCSSLQPKDLLAEMSEMDAAVEASTRRKTAQLQVTVQDLPVPEEEEEEEEDLDHIAEAAFEDEPAAVNDHEEEAEAAFEDEPAAVTDDEEEAEAVDAVDVGQLRKQLGHRLGEGELDEGVFKRPGMILSPFLHRNTSLN